MEKGKIKLFMRKNYSLVILLSIFFLLLFLNFDNIYLWQDEGKTAVLAKNTLIYGVPKVYDGKNWITTELNEASGILSGYECQNEDLIWICYPWLQFYVTALSFALFGFSTFSARILFVLLGFLSLFFIYRLYNKLYHNKKLSLIALIILMTGVSFFLHARQTRYYALLLFLTPCLLLCYLNLLKRRKKSDFVFFSLIGILLFYSNYLSFFITFIGITIHFIFFTDYKKNFKRMIYSYVLIVLFTLPWFIYANPLWRIQTVNVPLPLFLFSSFFSYPLFYINFTYPLILLIFLPLLLRRKNKYKSEIFADRFLFVFIFLSFLILAFMRTRILRHIIGFSPLVYLFFARLHYSIKKKNKVIGAIFILILITTNIFMIIPFLLLDNSFVKDKLINLCVSKAPVEKTERCDDLIKGFLEGRSELRFPFLYYLYEVTHDYDGPIEGIVKYLNEFGSEDDVVFIDTGHSPLMFYINMRVLDPNQYYDTALKPDWVIPRVGVEAEFLTNFSLENNYEKITIPYPNIRWENRPAIYYHKYWTVKNESKVIIYHKAD